VYPARRLARHTAFQGLDPQGPFAQRQGAPVAFDGGLRRPPPALRHDVERGDDDPLAPLRDQLLAARR
jgi:hypothetical protein